MGLMQQRPIMISKNMYTLLIRNKNFRMVLDHIELQNKGDSAHLSCEKETMHPQLLYHSMVEVQPFK
jgi:hypothetical protein